MSEPLNVLYYNTFLTKKMGEGLVSRQFLAAASQLDGWRLATIPAVTSEMLSASNVLQRHANGANLNERSQMILSLRKSLRRLRSPNSRAPIAPFLYTRRMTKQLGAAIQNVPSLDALLLHLSQHDLETVARVCRIVKTPIILRAPSPLAYQADHVTHRYMSRRARQNEQFLYEKADAILVISEAMKRLFVNEGVEPGKIYTIPNGIDLDRFAVGKVDGEAVRRRLGINGRKIVGYVGGFWPGNDLDTLLRAWRVVETAVSDATLLLVGYGPGLLPAQKLSRELNLKNCIWTGRVDHSQAPQYMAAMDVGVGPYVQEALAYVSPLKVIEYAAMGLPVVATRGGQVNKLIEDGKTGHTYKAGSAVEMADRILQMLVALTKARKMGERASQRVRRWYSWEKVAQDTLSICRQVAGRS